MKLARTLIPLLAIVPFLALSGCTGDDCPTGLVKCGGQCVNIMSDRSNCGACANACGSGVVCSLQRRVPGPDHGPAELLRLRDRLRQR